jgi:ribosomal protein L10
VRKAENTAAKLTAVRRQLKSNRAALKVAQQKFGAAVLMLLDVDAELRSVMVPKILAATTDPDEKAALEMWLLHPDGSSGRNPKH